MRGTHDGPSGKELVFMKNVTVGALDKKIDAVCRDKYNNYWLFEVKPTLKGGEGFCAIGQILAYNHLFEKEKTPCHTKMAIICKASESELEDACKKLDIDVFRV